MRFVIAKQILNNQQFSLKDHDFVLIIHYAWSIQVIAFCLDLHFIMV